MGNAPSMRSSNNRKKIVSALYLKNLWIGKKKQKENRSKW
jgi:hypothetical protein